MKLNWLLSISAIYLALIGLLFLIAPDAVLFGALSAGASAVLVAIIRVPASTFIGIAVLNWVARDAEPSKALIVVVAVVGLLLWRYVHARRGATLAETGAAWAHASCPVCMTITLVRESQATNP